MLAEYTPHCICSCTAYRCPQKKELIMHLKYFCTWYTHTHTQSQSHTHSWGKHSWSVSVTLSSDCKSLLTGLRLSGSVIGNYASLSLRSKTEWGAFAWVSQSASSLFIITTLSFWVVKRSFSLSPCGSHSQDMTQCLLCRNVCVHFHTHPWYVCTPTSHPNPGQDKNDWNLYDLVSIHIFWIICRSAGCNTVHNERVLFWYVWVTSLSLHMCCCI